MAKEEDLEYRTLQQINEQMRMVADGYNLNKEEVAISINLLSDISFKSSAMSQRNVTQAVKSRVESANVQSRLISVAGQSRIDTV